MAVSATPDEVHEAPRTLVRPPPDPRAAAAVAGLAHAALGHVTQLGSSHDVHRVETPAGSVVVKRPAPRAVERGRSLGAEAFAYRLASWREGLARAMPKVLLVDERREVIVLESIPTQRTGGWLVAQGVLPTAEASAALGRTLAQVHRATEGLPIPFITSSGVLDLAQAKEADIELEAAHDLAVGVSRHPVMGPGLDQARAQWLPSCLVHGDIKWDNCILDGEGDDSVVKLIDWEMSGYGDPAWDLATALAGSSALELGTGRPGQSDREAVVHGYFGAGGPADPARVALFWPPRVVHLALECAEAGDRQSGVELLNLAELLFLGRADLEGMIREWCSTFRQE